jgi:hypothetical protein
MSSAASVVGAANAKLGKAAPALVAALALLGLLGTTLVSNAAPSETEDAAVAAAGAQVLEFDIAENGKRFVFDETPVFEDGTPGYANEFVTEGYLYEPGTLDGSNGVNEDGSPEFPEKVVGRWVCRGWHVGEGGKTQTGPWVVTHQLFDFGDKPGAVSLMTDGFELVDINEPIQRAVIGGTGPFVKARGESTQVMTGFNKTNGVVLRMSIKVRK